MRFICNWSMCQNLNTLGVFWVNHVQMMQCCRKVVSRRELQVLLGSWLMLGVWSFSVQRFCLCLFLCIVMRPMPVFRYGN